jgi:hypothetical protein
VSNSLPSTEAAYLKLFDAAIAVVKEGDSSVAVPGNATFYDVPPLQLSNIGSTITYGQVLVGVEILQNYLYITRNYANYLVPVFEGYNEQGLLLLDATLPV